MGRGSNFAKNPKLRKLWFTRLAASGQFNKACLGKDKNGEPACKKRYTKISSKGLTSAGVGSISKKDKEFDKVVSQAKANYKKGLAKQEGNFDRSAATKTIAKQMKLEKAKKDAGEKIGKRAIIKTSTTEGGSTKARIRGEKDIRTTVRKTEAQKQTEQVRATNKAISANLTEKQRKTLNEATNRAIRIKEQAKSNPSLRGEAAKAEKKMQSIRKKLGFKKSK